MSNKHLGGTLGDLLEEDGVLEEVTLTAKKRAMALQLEDALRASRIGKTALATKLGTSRAQVDRVLDPDNESVTIKTLYRVGAALGLELQIGFAPMTTRRTSRRSRRAAPKARR